MSPKWLLMALAIGGVALFSLAACQEEPQSTATAVPFSPTAAQKANTPTPGAQPTQPGGATATSPAGQPTATPSGAAGNAQHGQQLFASLGCSACHSTGANTIVGPGLGGVADRAGSRVPGESADQYIEHSIREPGAFVVQGFSNLMPTTWKGMPAQDVADLIAYLKTLH